MERSTDGKFDYDVAGAFDGDKIKKPVPVGGRKNKDLDPLVGWVESHSRLWPDHGDAEDHFKRNVHCDSFMGWTFVRPEVDRCEVSLISVNFSRVC